MLFRFINNLSEKPVEYQLFWIYVLGQLKEEDETIVSIKELKVKFNYPKTKFYRVVNYGLPFFSNEEMIPF